VAFASDLRIGSNYLWCSTIIITDE
jgi:hypothetical protein